MRWDGVVHLRHSSMAHTSSAHATIAWGSAENERALSRTRARCVEQHRHKLGRRITPVRPPQRPLRESCCNADNVFDRPKPS